MIGGANGSSTVDEDRLRHLEVSPALRTLRLHTMKKGKSTEATNAAHGGDFDGVLSGAADTARFDKGGSNDGGYGPSAAASCENGNENIGVLRGQRTAPGCRDAYTAEGGEWRTRAQGQGDRHSRSQQGDDNTGGLRGERTTAECFDAHTAERGARPGDWRIARCVPNS